MKCIRQMRKAAALAGALAVLLHPPIASAQTWQSKIVSKGADGKLLYTADSEGNRIADFSYAGYKNGGAQIPDVAVVDSVGPVAGDNTANLQQAINRVVERVPDAQGFRGALLLKPGRYSVSGTLFINASGLVVRGSGEGSDSLSNTIIFATGDSLTQPTVIVAGGGLGGSNSTAWSGSLTTQVAITSDTVQVGAREFDVADASQFAVGDNIVIVHPNTVSWLRAVDWGGVPSDTGTSSYWAGQTIPIKYNRFITGIKGSRITVDAPVFNTMVRAISPSYCYKTNRSGILTNIGIEHLRVDINNPYHQSPANDGDERHHAQDAIWLGKIEDAWVRHCTALHFVQSGFKTSVATRVTIDSCSALDPISIVTGERRYNFNTYTASQLILFSNCYARYARHACVSNGTSTTSGIVFLNCTSEYSRNASEGHRLWSQALLYDNYRDVNTRVSSSSYVLGLYNRGNMGSGHGWAAAHSVAWNCDVGTSGIIIQKPPTAQNYAIGCTGTVSGNGPFAHPAGYIEGTNTPGLDPQSLYKAQLAERLSGVTSAASSSPDVGVGVSVPGEIRLEQNYPNPFNPSTVIRYELPVAGAIELSIFDTLGRLVERLVRGRESAGAHEVEWRAQTHPAGVYFCLLQSGDRWETRKLILLK